MEKRSKNQSHPFSIHPSPRREYSIKKESSSRRPRKREKSRMTPWHCARHARYRLLGPTTTCHRLVSLKTTSTPRNKGIVKRKQRGTREYKKEKKKGKRHGASRKKLAIWKCIFRDVYPAGWLKVVCQRRAVLPSDRLLEFPRRDRF